MTTDCECCHTLASIDTERIWLTYNGEIYNYQDLRVRLEAAGHRFHSATDSEVLLHLYAEEGLGMLKSLNGIFAFVIYDGRTQGLPDGVKPGDILVARDGVGVKPLYYSSTDSGFLFASELKALLQSSEVSREIDYEALHYYLTYLWAPAPITMLRGVKKLPPGVALLVREGVIVREWAHYDLPYGGEPSRASEGEICSELRERLETAVSRQMVADVDVGAFLSGGLDSSAIVAMMRRVRPDYVPKCYSIGFETDGDVDGNQADLPYARKVAAHLGVDLKVIVAKSNIINRLGDMLYSLDEPQGDPAPINVMLIAEHARAEGVKVLLSGAGGDDIFSGYRRHQALGSERLWSWLPGGVRSRLATRARHYAAGGSDLRWMSRPHFRRAAKALSNCDLSGDERFMAYFAWSEESLRRSLYSPELRDAVASVDTATPLRQSLHRIPNERDPLNRMLYLEGKNFLPDHNLNYTDKTAMASGVEVRVPLLDRDLVAFSTRIPASLKQRGSVGKAIFKRAMEPYLPSDVIYRPKSGFGAPLRKWLAGELRHLVDDVLSTSSLKKRGLFDPDAVHHLVALDRAGRIDGAYTIFSLMCIELWCRTFIDPPIPHAVATELV